jgi:WD40 repeat protein
MSELKMWDLSFRKCLWTGKAHTGFVRGVVGSPDGHRILSCGDDKIVKMWKARPDVEEGDRERLAMVSGCFLCFFFSNTLLILRVTAPDRDSPPWCAVFFFVVLLLLCTCSSSSHP